MDPRSPKRRRISQDQDQDHDHNQDQGPDDARDVPRLSPRVTRARRSSYASPTRASLARTDPAGLEQRDNETRERQQQRATEAAAARQATEDDARGRKSEATEPQTTAAPRRASTRSTATPAAAAPSPNRPNPRPFPPPGPIDDDPFPRTSRPQPATGITIPGPREPSLPPSNPDSIASTPPKGIHSSPSKWRASKRGRTPKSSPLKQSPLHARSEARNNNQESPSARRSRDAFAQPSQDENADLNPNVDPARKIPNQDPAKRKQRDKLQQELEQLQRDWRVASAENQRLLRLQTSGRRVAATNQAAILDLLRRHLVPADLLAQPPQSQQLLMAALNPMGLVPFQMANTENATNEELESLANIKSHHPVVMTSEEELPYLQLFSPFEITTTIVAEARTADQPFRQRRLINIRSRETPPLFHSRVEMIVNPMTLAILELSISAIDPAAKQELGPFADKICTGRCNRSMQRNVGVLSWAMGEWHRIALQRAEAWARLEQQLADKNAFFDAAAKLRVGKRRIQEIDEPDGPQATPVKNADILRFMGQQSFEIAVDQDGSAAHIRLEWVIGFDWTGEAESKVSALVGVPGKCKSTTHLVVSIVC